MYIFAKFLHIIGFTIWIGGMFFAHNCLRPAAAATLEPPQRLPLLCGVMSKFFTWVWVAIVLLFGSGMHMMAIMHAGGGKPPHYVQAMFLIAVVMLLIFGHIFFSAFKKMKRAVAAQDWPAGGAAMGQIRKLIFVNLILGSITIVVGALGPLMYYR